MKDWQYALIERLKTYIIDREKIDVEHYPRSRIVRALNCVNPWLDTSLSKTIKCRAAQGLIDLLEGRPSILTNNANPDCKLCKIALSDSLLYDTISTTPKLPATYKHSDPYFNVIHLIRSLSKALKSSPPLDAPQKNPFLILEDAMEEIRKQSAIKLSQHPLWGPEPEAAPSATKPARSSTSTKHRRPKPSESMMRRF